MVLEKYMAVFNDYLTVHKYSKRTIKSYDLDVRQFMNFITKHYPRINNIQKITKDILFDYQNYLMNYRSRNGRPLSNISQRCKLHAIKTFFRAMIKQDLILVNPTTSIRLPKEEERIRRDIPTQQEVLDILKSIKLNSPINIRNRAIAEVLYSCGIRTTELCNLMLEDVNFKEQTITIVKGKCGKSRVVPIGQYAAHYIQLYLEKSRKHMLKGKADPGNLFLSRKGIPFNRDTINLGPIRTILRNNKTDKHLSCYTFRHAAASHLLQNKVDIAYIAQLLGHVSLRTTQRYTKVEISDLKKMHAICHPRERE